jgi:transposase-like protein
MFIDGIEIGKHAVIVALGVTADGTKEPLGVWCGSTENHTVAAALLQNLIERGLRVDAPMLFAIDGGKGLRKALSDVFGDRAVVQRCQVHKARNVRDHLPQERRAYVRRQMRDAYKSKSAKTAKMLLGQLASWLEANGEDSAAASLREGLDETLTVLRLGLPTTLCRTFSTTNAIENMNGTLRRVIRNVKRWRGETMIQRWVALGIAEAQRGFRRVKGHAQMKALLAALRPNKEVVEDRKAA